ncbi:MAG: aminopeptidase P family protein [Rhizobiaceae bacterium]
MFQTFDSVANPTLGRGRVARLREVLTTVGVDGFLVPRADEHQGEYVAPGSERLLWLAGFAGSAGVALVLKDKAIVFVDGRYTLQVRSQTDMTVFTPESLVENPPHKWMADHLGKGVRIGFDPWLHTIGEVKQLREAAKKAGFDLVGLDDNPVDAIWSDRPKPPLEPVDIQPINLAGELAKNKLARLATTLAETPADHTVLTDPSSIAWVFNIRGSDVPHTPLPLAFAILSAAGEPRLYIDRRKLSIEPEAYLTQLATLRPPSALLTDLAELASSGATVALDPALAAEKLRMVVEEAGGTIVNLPDPARLPRARKNAAEIEGSRAAHRRDGAAVCRFLAWLDSRALGSVDEIGAVTALEEFRRRTGEEAQMPLRDISFDTISGAGPNGAIIHYRVSTATSRNLAAGELFLVDSGAQYRDGTTDITRTVAIGSVGEEERQRATLVLKGMIGISTLRFPVGTRGCDIDAVARLALWKAGLDYAHGTGHGVGSYLSVHEGPQRIAKTGTEKLLDGMILSNEPGYYKTDAYGIRLENLILVTPAAPIEGGDIPMHGFETLTLAPFDQRLVVADLLTGEEREWLDAYHARVLAEIGPMLDPATLAWLDRACAPL